MSSNPILQVKDLKTHFYTASGIAKAVDGVTFDLDYGKTLGIVGESGSGKSVTSSSIMRLLPRNGKIVSGEIVFEGKDLAAMKLNDMLKIRGKDISMVFQDPMTALDPVFTIGSQIMEVINAHQKLPGAEAKKYAVRALEMVGIPDPVKRLKSYPHEFSGGMRQRVIIAMAIACSPKLIIADEPTTALDVTVQQRILDLLQELVAEHSMALVLISHDLGVIAQNAEQLLVMYGGTVVESGMTEAVFARRAHPYTRGLFAARPQLQQAAAAHLPTIAGAVPELVDLPAGCPFAGRCAHTQNECYMEPPPPRTLHQPHQAAPASLASWRQPHLARCLFEQVLSTGAQP